ncbi:MAG: SatD family protein [Bacillota bacterium]
MASKDYYYVITADVIGSRREKNSLSLAEKGLSRLNTRYRAALAVDFSIYRGDEIQGFITEKDDLIRFLRHLRYYLKPLSLRIGVGCGCIETGLNKEFTWQMDGSAFHFSRASLNRIKSARVPATRFAGENERLWQTVNTFYVLLDAVQNRWSEKQWYAVDAYERGGTYEAAAAELQVSPQSVNKRCRAADWKAVAEVERCLAALIHRREIL